RFLAPMESHAQGPWYYLAVIAMGLAPWSLFLGLAMWYGGWAAVRTPWQRFSAVWRRAADQETDNGQRATDAYRYLWCWVLVYVVFFSIAATKLPNYVLPIAVPLAVLVGRFWDRWCRGEIAYHLATMRVNVILMAVVGLVVGAGLLIAAGKIDIT